MMSGSRSSAPVMKASKDVVNSIVFVLLIAFIGWNLFRLGLMVIAANSLL